MRPQSARSSPLGNSDSRSVRRESQALGLASSGRPHVVLNGAASDGEPLLQFFQDEGCRMVEMSCEQHDELSAETQFTTHFVGRTLGHVGLSKTAIDTKGYEALLNLVENTTNDSFELFYGLFMYNEASLSASKAMSAIHLHLMPAPLSMTKLLLNPCGETARIGLALHAAAI